MLSGSDDWVYVLFDWDTHFAALMLSLDAKELSYSVLIQIVKAKSAKGEQLAMPGSKEVKREPSDADDARAAALAAAAAADYDEATRLSLLERTRRRRVKLARPCNRLARPPRRRRRRARGPAARRRRRRTGAS